MERGEGGFTALWLHRMLPMMGSISRLRTFGGPYQGETAGMENHKPNG